MCVESVRKHSQSDSNWRGRSIYLGRASACSRTADSFQRVDRQPAGAPAPANDLSRRNAVLRMVNEEI